MIGPFLNVKDIVFFEACFRKIRAKLVVFYEFLILNLAILTNFEGNLAFTLPLFSLYSFLRSWPFLKLLMAKFGLFNFSRPGNPDI